MTHSLAPNLALDDLYSTFFTNYTSVLHPLILTTVTLIVLDRTKYLGTKQTISFWLEGPVINGLGFLYLTKRPLPNLLGRSQRYLNGVKT
jgi:hypothetical protein